MPTWPFSLRPPWLTRSLLLRIIQSSLQGRAALARQLGLAGPKAEAEAAEAAKSFLDSLPGVKSWIASVRQAVGTTGTVRTLCGRVRRFPPSPQGDVRARMERQAVSTITQGSASDVAKLAMVAVTRTIASLGGGAALVLQVHDELLLEVDAGRVRDLAREIAGAMERVTSLKVKLPVRTMVGPSWGEMKDLPL